ncbi:hypothetical protein WA1_32645 [Scytonema hofmannii PCC 7110]|uniref:Filamentous haemagglutinin FhaB/tRNA nuclease CdiA-like TPS domain-containing protein n=1 Tax=Scytonema hofmannii PCC 7110 TaxID=128403 RepID=A0A139X463_9CYAN|nr:filamentous hemagglutinin N-terminal domain-containing protein [Scytonema hofmannii]KYC39470.1 hypothetical protein WA1_32645 [Scytonema hofmannii PCC 7110]
METKHWLSCWQLGFVGLLSTVGINIFTCKALSQSTPSNIQPDNTLGIESSQILQNQNFQGLPIELIVGGATRGINLFHSFREFNVTSGRGAYFLSPSVDIQNILARVTGGNRSEILGRLGTLSESKPNLFLINPNGMIFGERASLDVQGSFVGTTANGAQFGNQGVFSATNPQAPPLLSINPSALLFNQINQTAGITNRSLAPAGVSFAGDVTGLRVPDGKSLLLIGGNVTMAGGQLNAFGGRVELGGLAEPGSINLVLDSDRLSLKFPENVARADVLLSERAFVFVEGAGGGDIAVNARNLEVSGGSIFSAGIGAGLGTPETVAGDIVLNATGDIKVTGSGSQISQIRNLVRLGSKGNGGNININTGSLLLRDGARLSTSTSGIGNGGNVTVRALDAVSLAGNAYILSTVEASGVGKAGNIDINAANVSLIDGAQLVTITRRASDNQPAARGDGGNVTVKVTGAVDIAGRKNDLLTGIFSSLETGTVGNGGNITIDSGSFSLRDGAQLTASTFGQGNGGNVTVRALDAVSLAGNAAILSTVEAGGVGKGGNIDINAVTLSLADGAQLQTSTVSASATQPAGRGDAGNVNVKVTGAVDITGQKNGLPSGIRSRVRTGAVGNGGDITIDSGSFSLRDSAQLSASTFGIGNAGNVTVRAQDAVSLASASISSTVEASGVGKGGNIDINAATLSLIDGAQLLTSTRGASATQPSRRGDAGNVNVKVTGVVDIAGQKNGFLSGIGSFVGTGTVSNGGNITIDTGSFSLRDSAQIDTSTSGRGNAGNVTVRAQDAVSLAGNASILSTVEAGGVGKGGSIEINAATLSLIDGAQLVTITRRASDNQPAGRGDAGNVNVKVSGAVDIVGQKNGFSSAIGSFVGTGTVGNGGDITIDSGSFSLRDSAQLSASTFGIGNGGNVTVRALDAISLADASILSVVEAGAVGKGGNIDINAASLSLIDSAQLLTITRGASATQPAGRGDAGNVNVKVTGTVDIAGQKNGFSSGIFSDVGSATIGNGGDITINSVSFSLRDDAEINASTSGQGNGGNVTVRALDAVSLADANILSTVEASGVGKGGNININAATLSLVDGAQINASTYGLGNAGNVTVRAVDAVSLTDGAEFITSTFGQGNAGNIYINAKETVTISGISQEGGFSSGLYSDTVEGSTGEGGNITVNTNIFRILNGASIDAGTANNNKGGDITVNTNVFEATSGGQLSTNSSSNGGAGKITVNATDKVKISGSDPNYNDRIATFSLEVVENISADSGFFVSSSGSGITGDIEINSPKITLDNQGRLIAESTSGNGGNINLNSNLLLLRRGAQISTNAGTEQKGGDGGNININSKFIVAVPQENSDITANAFQGRGGNINITARGIFGIEARSKPSEQINDITASSDLGLSGTINLNSPDNSSVQNSLSQLSQNLVDSNALIASSCIVRSNQKQQNSFTITGTGGLPNRPGDLLVSNYATGSVRNVTYSNQSSSINSGIWKKGDPIIEPQGVYRTTSGQIVLSRECR